MSIPNLSPNTVYAIHLRASSVSGGKDWIGSVTGNCEIHTFWGKTGLIHQHAAKQGNNLDLQKIIDQKKNKGYSFVDDYTEQKGWSSQKQQVVPASQPNVPVVPPKSVTPIVNWNEAPASPDAIKWDF